MKHIFAAFALISFLFGDLFTGQWAFSEPRNENILFASNSSLKKIRMDRKILNNLSPKLFGKVSIQVQQDSVKSRNNLTFGSEQVMLTLWSPVDLRGSINDKKISYSDSVKKPVKPDRLMPEFTLRPLGPEMRGLIKSIEVTDGGKYVALTFDLCEKENNITGYDAEIVNYLRENGIRATFFAGGKWMRSHPEKAKELIADPLFEIGNHSWSHSNFSEIHGTELIDQVLWAQAEYELLREELVKTAGMKNIGFQEFEKIPSVPYLFRFPYGTFDEEALNFLASRGLMAIQWDVVTGDPDPKQTSEGIVREVLKKVKSGSIVICHANGFGHGTAKALPLFIPKLLSKL